MKALSAIFGIGVLCCLQPGAVAQTPTEVRGGPSCADSAWLRDYGSRFEWMHALAEPGGKDVDVVLLTEGQMGADAARHVAESGGRIEVSYPEIGYARASIARSRVAALAGALECTGISFVLDAGDEYIDDVLNQQGRRPAPAGIASSAPPEPSSPADTMTAADRATLLRKVRTSSDEALGLLALRKRFPDADGRGIVVAVVEGVADFSLPTLQYGVTAAGERVSKTVDVLLPDRAPETIDLVSCSGVLDSDAESEITLGDVVHRLRFDRHRRSLQLSRPGDRDVDVVPVDPGDNRLPTTLATKEGRRFAFKWHTASQRMCAVRAWSHPTTVTEALSGLAADGTAVGAAPAARIVYVPPRLKLHGRIEGVVRAALDPRVDLVSVSLGFRALPNDQGSWVARTIDRVAAYTNKPIVLAAGNSGGAIQTTGAPIARRALVIGGLIPGDLARVPILSFDYGREHVPESSSRGPGGDGLLKPDVVAPTFHVDVRRTGSGLVGGTSHATPTAAGALAVLLGIARARGAELSLEHLLRAIRHTAKPVAGAPVSHTGYGRMDVNAAWQYLREFPRVDNLEVCIRTTVPGTPASVDCSREPSVLVRGGVHTNDVIGFAVTWKKKHARGATPRVAVRASPSGLQFEPRDVTAGSFAFDLRAVAPGIHMAWVDLGAHASPGTIPITLVVAERVSASRVVTAKLERLDRLDIPVEVTADTRTLTLDLRSSSPNLRVQVQEPWGYRLRSWRENHPRGPLLVNPASRRSVVTVPNPMSGTWIVSLTADAFDWREEPPDAAVASVSLTIQQRQHDAAVATRHSTDGIIYQLDPGAFGDPIVRLLRGARQERMVHVTGHAPVFLDFSVPAAARVLAVEAAARATDTRFSLYVYHCLADGCAPHVQLEPSRRSQRFVLNTPAEGVWRIGILATEGCQPACDVSVNAFVGATSSESMARGDKTLQADSAGFGCFLSDAGTDGLEQRLPFLAAQPVGKWPLTIDFATATGADGRCSLVLREP